MRYNLCEMVGIIKLCPVFTHYDFACVTLRYFSCDVPIRNTFFLLPSGRTCAEQSEWNECVRNFPPTFTGWTVAVDPEKRQTIFSPSLSLSVSWCAWSGSRRLSLPHTKPTYRHHGIQQKKKRDQLLQKPSYYRIS